MRLQLRNLTKGFDIEIGFATHDNKIWHQCTITYIDADVIKAAAASGHVFTVNRHDYDNYRIPQPWKKKANV